MLGVDVVENERIREAIKRFGDRFRKRVFTEKEIQYCERFKDPIPCLASRWACKEAVLKAFFAEFGYLLKFKDIEVLGNLGKPARVNIRDRKAVKILGDRRIVVSLSHERSVSVAVALIK